MSLASFATSVPQSPDAMPMCAFLRAGASFEPSPVTATILPSYMRSSTTLSFASGVHLATSLSLDTIVEDLASMTSELPSRQTLSSLNASLLAIPASIATYLAATILSPVTKRTLMPILFYILSTTSLMPGRNGSPKAKIPIMVMSDRSRKCLSLSSAHWLCSALKLSHSFLLNSLYEMHAVLMACSEYSLIFWRAVFLAMSSSYLTMPSAPIIWVHRSRFSSEAPLEKTHTFAPSSTQLARVKRFRLAVYFSHTMVVPSRSLSADK